MMKAKTPAPDVNVIMWDGSEKNLSHFWQEKKLVLVFLRHLG